MTLTYTILIILNILTLGAIMILSETIKTISLTKASVKKSK